MPRFYVEPEYIKDKRVSISGADARHIRTVLRLDRGDMIDIFDGSGREYAVLIETIGAAKVEGRIIGEKFVEAERLVEVTLFQGLPKASKMDLIIQKSTELGVCRIVPMITSRSIPDLDSKKKDLRISRWKRIAVEASKQSGRTKVPHVEDILKFSDAFAREFDLKLIMWESEREAKLKEVLGKCHVSAYPCRVGVFVGPEGGFTNEEIGQARYMGAIPVSMGPRILRTETAGMIATAILMYELEPSIKIRDHGSDN